MHTHLKRSESVFTGAVYMVSGMTTPHWTTKRRPTPGILALTILTPPSFFAVPPSYRCKSCGVDASNL